MTKEIAVRLGDGTIISLADLPETNTTRWGATNKASVVRVFMAGLVSQEEIMQRYELSAEEFQNWLNRYVAGGTRALKAVGQN